MKTTLYQILGVPPDASREQIAAAYRTALAAPKNTGHPDPNAATFLRDAYQILSNDTQRAAYDASLARTQRVAGTPVAVVDERRPGGWTPWVVGAVLLAGAVVTWQWRKGADQPAVPKTALVAPKGDARRLPAEATPVMPVESTATAPARSSDTAPVAAQPAVRSAEEIFVQLAPSVA